MTAMMALFLVLWLVTQSSDVRSAIAGYFQDPLGRANEFGSSIIPGEGAQAASPRPISQTQLADLRRDRLQMLGERIRQALAKYPDFGELASHIEIDFTDEGLRIQLLEDSSGVFFVAGSAHPRAAGVALLGLLGQQLSTMRNTVLVDGYTDAVPYSNTQSTYTNWELSSDRANASRRILLAGGLHEGQVAQVRGHGDRDLRFPDAPTSASNRRVTITMLFDTPGDSLAIVDSLRKGILGALTAPIPAAPAMGPAPDGVHAPAAE
jgi:chemotaxis protein MotB